MAYQIKRYCDNCGKEVGLEALFCPYCGTKIEDETPTTEVASDSEKKTEKVIKNEAEKTPVQQEPQKIIPPKVEPKPQSTPGITQHHIDITPEQASTSQQNESTTTTNVQKNDKELLKTLCRRIKIDGRIWAVIGCLQIGASLSFSYFGIDWVLVVVGVFNLLLGIYDYNLGKKWEKEPKDIIKATKPLAVPIIVLVYNILIGGIIGIAGSIYYLIAIRNFVIEYESYFAQFDSKE